MAILWVREFPEILEKVSDWISFPKTNMQGEKRALEKENIYKPQLYWVWHVGFRRCWRELISSHPKQILLSLGCSPPPSKFKRHLGIKHNHHTNVFCKCSHTLLPSSTMYWKKSNEVYLTTWVTFKTNHGMTFRGSYWWVFTYRSLQWLSLTNMASIINPLYTENNQGQLVTAQLDTYRESCPNTGKPVDNDG